MYGPDDLPETRRDWKKAIVAEKLSSSTIHHHGNKLQSASRFRRRDFLLLRVLWQPVRTGNFRPEDFHLNQWIAQANPMLARYQSWRLYIESFDGNPREGNFFLAKHYQMETSEVQATELQPEVLFSPVANRTRGRQQNLAEKMRQVQLETPSKSTGAENAFDDSFDADESDVEESDESSLSFSDVSPLSKEAATMMYPNTKDEQIVNTSLVIFLNALTAHFQLSNDWTMHRRILRAGFKSTFFEARTDGYLADKHNGHVRALIEVKSGLRSKNSSVIRIQESCQEVAWLLGSPNTPGKLPGRRVHISQDRHQIYLIFADYEDGYLDYLKGDEELDPSDPSSNPSFLTMYEVGPYDTTDQTDMKALAPILLAITLRADDDRKNELAEES